MRIALPDVFPETSVALLRNKGPLVAAAMGDFVAGLDPLYVDSQYLLNDAARLHDAEVYADVAAKVLADTRDADARQYAQGADAPRLFAPAETTVPFDIERHRARELPALRRYAYAGVGGWSRHEPPVHPRAPASEEGGAWGGVEHNPAYFRWVDASEGAGVKRRAPERGAGARLAGHADGGGVERLLAGLRL